MAGWGRAAVVARGLGMAALLAAGCTSRRLAADAGTIGATAPTATDAAGTSIPAADASQPVADASGPVVDAARPMIDASRPIPDASLPIRDASGARDAGAVVVQLASAVIPARGMPDAIAIDDDGVYWTTTDNGVWALDTAATQPRRLAADNPDSSLFCLAAGRLAAGKRHVFWRSPDATLRRALKDGSAEAILADRLRYVSDPTVRTDADRVYWSDGDGNPTPDLDGPGAVIDALAQDAAPGTTPSLITSVDWILEVDDFAISGGVLYADTLPTTGTTVPIPGLEKMVLGVSAQGPATLTSLRIAGSSPRPSGGDLFFIHYLGLHERALSVLRGGASDPTDIASIDELGADDIIPFDDWILISVPRWSCGDRQHRLVAVPTTPGRPMVQLAGDMGTRAVLGASFAYGDLAGNVHLATLAQLRAALISAVH